MKRSITMDITRGGTKEDFASFLDAVPDGVKITVDVYHQEGDRPWESASNTVTLEAEWTA